MRAKRKCKRISMQKLNGKWAQIYRGWVVFYDRGLFEGEVERSLIDILEIFILF